MHIDPSVFQDATTELPPCHGCVRCRNFVEFFFSWVYLEGFLLGVSMTRQTKSSSGFTHVAISQPYHPQVPSSPSSRSQARVPKQNFPSERAGTKDSKILSERCQAKDPKRKIRNERAQVKAPSETSEAKRAQMIPDDPHMIPDYSR